jgi:hypothetical protein
VFCETRQLAEEWTYRYLAAARAWAITEHPALQRISPDNTVESTDLDGAPAAPEPSTAEIRTWARGIGLYPTAADSDPKSGKPGTTHTTPPEPSSKPRDHAHAVVGYRSSAPKSPGAANSKIRLPADCPERIEEQQRKHRDRN